MRVKRICCIFLIIAMLLCSLCVPSLATQEEPPPTRVSQYFSSTSTWITSAGNGRLWVHLSIQATGTMLTLGAHTISLYEQQSGGGYSLVKTFTAVSYPSMLTTNTAIFNIQLYYQGKANTRYYAVSNCYARNASGSETKQSTSNSVLIS